MPRPKPELYPLQKSPFWRMGRQRDLSPLLQIGMKEIRWLAANREQQYWRREREIGGKQRKIVCPFGAMRRVHERLQGLLNRIMQPRYLHSPRRGRTALGNAAVHRNAAVIGKLDIRQFYPSTTDEHVFRFFYHRMSMRDDVAGLLVKLCTVDGRLAFGSPLSPILCSLVHRDLFDQIEQICLSGFLNMSLWVDDITVSGDMIPTRLIWAIKHAIHAKGLRYHKVRVTSLRHGPVITGHHVSLRGIVPANKHHIKVRDALAVLDHTSDRKLRLESIQSLIGQTNHARLIYPPEHPVRARLNRRRDWLHQERRSLEQESFKSKPNTSIPVLSPGDVSLPWASEESSTHTRFIEQLQNDQRALTGFAIPGER